MLVLMPPTGLLRKPPVARNAHLEAMKQAEALALHVESLLDTINMEIQERTRQQARLSVNE